VRLSIALRYLGLLVASVILLAPIYYMLYIATSKSGNEFTFGVVPSPFRPSNLYRSLQGSADNPGSLAPYFWNSTIYAGLATLGALITQSFAGYAFARLEFPGKKILFALTIAMLMMPFVVTLIPRFLLFRKLGLTDSLAPLILPWWFGGSAYGIFLMRQFFMSVPRSLDDAARVDGAGHVRILWRVLIPQAGPVIAALAILEGSYFWNDLLGPLIYTSTAGHQPLSLGIFQYGRSPYGYDYARFFSILAAMVAPVALVFLALQRRFQRAFLYSGLGGR
jgi:ABC-type glycerol-3-phosphate transport system permease component